MIGISTGTTGIGIRFGGGIVEDGVTVDTLLLDILNVFIGFTLDW